MQATLFFAYSVLVEVFIQRLFDRAAYCGLHQIQWEAQFYIDVDAVFADGDATIHAVAIEVHFITPPIGANVEFRGERR